MDNIIGTLKERLSGVRWTWRSTDSDAGIATSEKRLSTAPYPHCDSNVLHSPGRCVFCDKFKDAQQARIYAGINFTGEDAYDRYPDPATQLRPLEVIERWGGNRPKTQKDLDDEEEAWRKFAEEWDRDHGSPWYGHDA